MTQRTWLLLLLTAILALCLAACSSNEGTTPTTTETTEETVDEAPAPEAPAEEAPAVEPTPEEPEPEPEAEVGSDIDDVASLEPEGAFSGAAEALTELNSYRYSTLFTFVGEEDGEIEAGSIELTGIVAGPGEKHLVWMNLEDEERFEVIQLRDRAWVLDEGEWTEAPVMVAEAMSQAVLIYAPSVAWSGIFGELEPTATYVGREIVNGISAYHYTSNYKQWGGYWSGELENASGDVWIAEAGYPVKYEFSATGIDEDGDRGTVTWRMDLADVNTEITIEPPISTP